MPITYQQESLLTVKKDVVKLAFEDWEETTEDKEAHPFEIDWDLYETLEDCNALLIFTARSDNELVGYFSVIKSPDPHSKGNFIVCNDAIFLSKSFRKGMVGVNLIKFVEKCIKEDGYKNLVISFTTKNDISPLLERLGYYKTEIKFEKRLV